MGFHRNTLLAVGSLVWMAVALGGMTCKPQKLFKSVSPADGSTVSTFSFTIDVNLGGGATPGTLTAELNGQDITGLFTGGPVLYSAAISPGPPLQDLNDLVLSAQFTPTSAPISRTFQFDYLPPKARAELVVDSADCITGPLAHCTVGDYLLSNSEARFVVQKPLQREAHAVGVFGGNLIDAERVVGGVPQGNDNFFEIQPGVNLETVINATSAVIVNDGQDGTTAIVRTCGPDDLLDDINPSSVVAGLGIFPAETDDKDYDLIGCTEYRLEPLTRTLELATEIESLLGPTEFCAGPGPVPGSCGLYVGDYVNGGGELEQISPLSDAALVQIGQAGVGELFANWGIDAMSFFGFDEAAGTDYGLVVPQPPSVAFPSSSFTTSGVSFVMHGNSIPFVLAFGAAPTFFVPAGGTSTFTRWFTVGDGSAGNAIDASMDLLGTANGTLQGCVTEAGSAPVPGATVIAARDTAGGTSGIEVLRNHFVADASGCYAGRMPVGNYLVAAAKEGFAYEGGGSTPVTHLVTVTAGGTTTQDVDLPANGRLRVEVFDHLASPVPARIGIVGFDPSPDIGLLASVITTNDASSAAFADPRDGVPTGLTRTEYTDAGGVVELDLEPGDYQLAVSRGTEWSLFTQAVTITPGSSQTVMASIAEVVDSTGFVSSDAHVHLIESPDSRISRRNRIHSFAGEGVDNIIATDHAAITDLLPDIAAHGLDAFVHATPGEEITTFDYGHFNAYPQGLDPSQVQTKGSTDHGGVAPAGMDFPSLGNWNLTPAQIESLVLTDPDNAGLSTVVQINHIDSHYDPLKIDTALTPPASQLGPGEPEAFRLDPAVPNFFHHFTALEVWNGVTIGHQNEFLDDRIGIWMNQLNQGLITTAIGDTDTHTYHNLRQGGARSWTPSSTDAPAGIVDAEIGQAVQNGQVVAGQGIYVQARLLATDGSGGVADFALGGSTLVAVTNNAADLEIHVQAPTWAPYDTIEIYRNASTTVTGTNGGVPTLYSAIPTTTLTAGVDFTVNTVAVNGSQRLDTLHVESLTGVAADEWIVVLVKGTPGVSPPMFPVMVSGVDVDTENTTLADLINVTAAESGIRALGFTNALYLDVDGSPGFDPPGVSVSP